MTNLDTDLAKRIADGLLERNQLCDEFFAAEAPRLAQASREMADRFLRGGRLWPSDAVLTPPMRSTSRSNSSIL